jgi:hypothetical protein
MAAAFAAAAEPVPFTLNVRVRWAEGARGSTLLRDDIERSVLDALADRACYREVTLAGRGELRLDVELDELREETHYDDSLAEHADPSTPGQDRRLTSEFEIFVRWTLAAPEPSDPIRTRRFRIARVRRPLLHGEDSAARARNEGIESLGAELARGVCSVPRKKVDAALAGVRR